MKLNLEGKIALVTASSKGIGFAVASGLFEAGACVGMCARGAEGLEQAVARLAPNAPNRVFALPGDVGDPSFLQTLVSGVQERFGGTIDICINNNGGPPVVDATLATEEQWRGAIDRNLMSAVRTSALVVPGMKAKKWGRIINLTSTTAKEPDPGMVLSSVTRAGVSAFAKTLAREVGPFGITVNTVLTGGCMTDRLVDLLRRDAQASGETYEAVYARVVESIPTRYIPEPTEFAQTVLFLVSPDAGFLNGVSVPVDGGLGHSVF
jgi:3-oxoacyl-[acyl-carrier protein] reductase